MSSNEKSVLIACHCSASFKCFVWNLKTVMRLSAWSIYVHHFRTQIGAYQIYIIIILPVGLLFSEKIDIPPKQGPKLYIGF